MAATCVDYWADTPQLVPQVGTRYLGERHLTQSKIPSVYKQILALMGQIQLRQERIESRLDIIQGNTTYLRNRTLAHDEGNVVAFKNGEPLSKVENK